MCIWERAVRRREVKGKVSRGHAGQGVDSAGDVLAPSHGGSGAYMAGPLGLGAGL